jgi:hypothetical protein
MATHRRLRNIRIIRAAAAALLIGTAAARAGDLPATPSAMPDVTVFTPAPPAAQDLPDDSLFQFIVHHGTVHYPSSVAVRGGLMRWRGGRSETICPHTVGLDPGYDAYLSARLRALAAYVGAPVAADSDCKDSVRILFTTDPQKLMEEVTTWAGKSLGVKYPHQTEKLLEFSSTHAIQGWYLTAGGSSVLNRDPGLIGRVSLLPLWPLVIPTGLHGGGARSIASVIIVVDTTKVTGYTIGTISDYIAMLTLSVIQLPDHCDPLPSILDLMSSTCGSREKPTAITAGDLAFLKALYFHNTGLGATLSRDDIQSNMLQQFRANAAGS